MGLELSEVVKVAELHIQTSSKVRHVISKDYTHGSKQGRDKLGWELIVQEDLYL